MVTTKKPETDAEPAEEPSGDLEVLELPTSWQFVNEVPTVETVRERLATLNPVWGVKMVDYHEYVQPLSQNKKVSKRGEPDQWAEIWTLYFTVAGRIAMINDAQELHDWSVSFIPDPSATPAGYVEFVTGDGGRIVYRELCEIRREDGMLLGSRAGTAWVPYEGGANAVATNRYEKVETAARGRSIAAWKFGVLPGSGVASLEEMQSTRENAAAPRGGRRQQQPKQTPMSRDDAISSIRTTSVELMDLQGVSPSAMDERLISYVRRTFDHELTWGEGGALDFKPLKDGEVVIVARRLEQELTKARAEKSEL